MGYLFMLMNNIFLEYFLWFFLNVYLKCLQFEQLKLSAKMMGNHLLNNQKYLSNTHIHIYIVRIGGYIWVYMKIWFIYVAWIHVHIHGRAQTHRHCLKKITYKFCITYAEITFTAIWTPKRSSICLNLSANNAAHNNKGQMGECMQRL